MLRYAISVPNGGECGDPRILTELAHIAEDAGWDGIFLEDYIVYTNSEYYSLPGYPTYDPWVSLAAMAMRTTRIRLGTSVTPVSRRRPWKLAKEAVTLDHLSGGRVLLGAGAGDAEASFTAFGEAGSGSGKTRAELLDEGLEILAGLWSGEPFSYHGKHFTIAEVTCLPRPVQSPRIPIWVGGQWPLPGPTHRAARWDGSCLFKHTADGTWQDMTAQDVRELRAVVERERGSLEGYDIAVGGHQRGKDWEAERAHIRTVAEAGATWWAEWVPAADYATMRAAIARGPLFVV